jgi:putative toxin-antitoxin system antitoxin component (TIGR02293 family)
MHRRSTAKALLKPDESERAIRLGSVFDHAVDVLGNEQAARRWFMEPRAELNGMAPLDACDTEPGRIEVDRVLGRIEHGVFS